MFDICLCCRFAKHIFKICYDHSTAVFLCAFSNFSYYPSLLFWCFEMVHYWGSDVFCYNKDCSNTTVKRPGHFMCWNISLSRYPTKHWRHNPQTSIQWHAHTIRKDTRDVLDQTSTFKEKIVKQLYGANTWKYNHGIRGTGKVLVKICLLITVNRWDTSLVYDLPVIWPITNQCKAVLYKWGAGMAQWWVRLPPTNVSQVRFLDPASCGSSLLLVLFLALRGFSPGTLVFPSPQKSTFPNSNLIWIIIKYFMMSLWLRWSPKHSLSFTLI